MVHTNTHIFLYFYEQYSVQFTMVTRNNNVGRSSISGSRNKSSISSIDIGGELALAAVVRVVVLSLATVAVVVTVLAVFFVEMKVVAKKSRLSTLLSSCVAPLAAHSSCRIHAVIQAFC